MDLKSQIHARNDFDLLHYCIISYSLITIYLLIKKEMLDGLSLYKSGVYFVFNIPSIKWCYQQYHWKVQTPDSSDEVTEDVCFTTKKKSKLR